MYLSLYRKWRPDTFSQIVGQEHVTRVLQNAIKMGRIHHAYLFCGPRGTGKTSTARLFAKALNCEKGPAPEPCNSCPNCMKIKDGHFSDLIEIDAASNRGIDEIRELRERVRFSPVEGRYKVYIIDEVHMLTVEAFNALLKTLEEPPPHCIFILATTEPQKIPLTISSRCQYLNFYRLPFDDILKHLRQVARDEGVNVAEEGLRLIARKAEGGLRDALGLLEQAISFGGKDVSGEDVQRMLGTIDKETLSRFVAVISEGRAAEGFLLIKEIIDKGKSLDQFLKDLLEYFRDLMVVAECKEKAWELVAAFEDERERLKAEAARFKREDFVGIMTTLSETLNSLRYASHGRILLEMTLLKLISLVGDTSASISREETGDLKQAGKVEKMEGEIESLCGELFEKGKALENKGDEGIKGVSSDQGVEPPVKEGEPLRREGDASPTESMKLHREAGSPKLSDFVAEWRTILNAVKKESVKVHAFLIVGEPLRFEGDVLTIKFTSNYSFHKQSLEKGPNKLILERVLEGLFNKSIKVECLLVDDEKNTGLENDDSAERLSAASRGGGVNLSDRKNEGIEDDLVKAALDIFGGKVVKVET